MSDGALFRRFLALPQVETAGAMLLFRGVGREPDTRLLVEALLERGKTVCLPRCLPQSGMEARAVRGPEDLAPGRWDIPEPGEACPLLPREMLDLILVPALCYDRLCRRLGQGGGYYDRYLAGYGGATVGLCREGLLQEAVPVEAHDRPVDCVLTERETILRPGGSACGGKGMGGGGGPRPCPEGYEGSDRRLPDAPAALRKGR